MNGGCTCGHGQYHHRYHGLVDGFGTCSVEGCDCPRFHREAVRLAQEARP